MMFRNEKAFKPEAFLSPDRNYAPIYAWVWNGVLSEEKSMHKSRKCAVSASGHSI